MAASGHMVGTVPVRNGMVSLPAEVRKRLDLECGDFVIVTAGESGELVLKKVAKFKAGDRRGGRKPAHGSGA